jgi:hypothetical protein
MSKPFKISKILRLAVLSTLLSCVGCHKPNGSINLNFSFVNDNGSLQLDSCIYENPAGNLYEVNDVQYFISKVMLEDESGKTVEIADNEGVHYVDIRIPSTLAWPISDEIPAGSYRSISFVFGLEGEQNTTGYFPNPPENNMSWPDIIGGGYHYMKINGRWVDAAGVKQPFNLHTGKIADGDGFIDNTFTVTIPLKQFVVSKNSHTDLTLVMNVNNWFSDPYLFDFNEFGGSIMQNREAQEVLRANGHNVFSLF